ncbi:MAG: 2-oxoglutarate dehydrogenase complex dihydrolipoyllysine-residue succinyltransferase [Chloroflexi bacterium]|nr:2-oxoglutarate dehydrogenase complex dihydrolipoyllysine-residue succinyltransferase [Chloroflexota bacterium]
MAVEIRVPQMGESIVEATVGKWLKREGERVTAGEPVIELETEKVNVEVPAPQDGTLGRILKREGDNVSVGELLGTIAEGAAQAQPSQQPPEPQAQPSQTTGQAPSARAEEAAPTSGGAEEAEEAQVTPVARNLAKKFGIDLSKINGKGRGGRITQEDIEEYIASTLQRSQAQAQPSAPPEPVLPLTKGEPEGVREAPPRAAPPREAPVGPRAARYEERVRLSRRRRTIAQRLVEAHQTAAMTTTYNEIDMSAVIELRRRRREAFRQRHGVDLGFMSFFVKAAVGALKAFPNVNSELDGDELVMKYYYDIGIAVGSDEGLVVPVLRDADKKSFAQIEEAIGEMVKRTRERTLTLEELQGGTFTITNGGVFGSLLSTPLLNPPQVGILGMHRIMERPVIVDGQIVARPMMYVALTYDHRVVDGAEAVQFLVRVKELVEDPSRLLLEV